MLELIINQNNNVETTCLVENGKLIEKYQNDEISKKNRLEGNIYAGKVIDIVPGMQSAFIDYGEPKNGLMHLKDAIPQTDEKMQTSKPIDKNINDILKPNQKVLVQIKKDSNDKKGAKISTHITIPSRYIVFMPNTNIITISQKIQNEKRKEELLKIAKDSLKGNNGLVLRTSAEKAHNEEIINDIKKCMKKWNNILKLYEESKPGTIVYESESIQEKIMIDVKVDRVITNKKEEFEKLKKLVEFEGMTGVKIEYTTKSDLLDMYDINSQLQKIDNRKIWLNCGGFITIDKTEALTAIDVNTGKFTGKSDLENTIYKVNKEATIEIAKQLRLHDIGGIIIIDYIDMHTEENKKKIEELLKEQLKNDRAKTQVEGFTKLNLMEMTRKHICSHLDIE